MAKEGGHLLIIDDSIVYICPDNHPKAALDWERYRQQLGTIEGLALVDLPNMCCKRSAEKIIEQAEKMQVDKILSACNWCHFALMPTAKRRMPMIRLSELLVQSLESSNVFA